MLSGLARERGPSAWALPAIPSSRSAVWWHSSPLRTWQKFPGKLGGLKQLLFQLSKQRRRKKQYKQDNWIQKLFVCPFPSFVTLLFPPPFNCYLHDVWSFVLECFLNLFFLYIVVISPIYLILVNSFYMSMSFILFVLQLFFLSFSLPFIVFLRLFLRYLFVFFPLFRFMYSMTPCSIAISITSIKDLRPFQVKGYVA